FLRSKRVCHSGKQHRPIRQHESRLAHRAKYESVLDDDWKEFPGCGLVTDALRGRLLELVRHGELRVAEPQREVGPIRPDHGHADRRSSCAAYGPVLAAVFVLSTAEASGGSARSARARGDHLDGRPPE